MAPLSIEFVHERRRCERKNRTALQAARVERLQALSVVHVLFGLSGYGFRQLASYWLCLAQTHFKPCKDFAQGREAQYDRQAWQPPPEMLALAPAISCGCFACWCVLAQCVFFSFYGAWLNWLLGLLVHLGLMCGRFACWCVSPAGTGASSCGWPELAGGLL